MKRTEICNIEDSGKGATERVIASNPEDIGRCITGIDGDVIRAGLEADPLAPWLLGRLAERGRLSSVSRFAR